MKIVDIHGNLYTLIEQARRLDRDAQKALYQKYAPKLLSVCRQYMQDIYLAEDMLVTSFMKILMHLDKFEHKGSFEAWIRRIAVNECISYIRANKKVKYTEPVDMGGTGSEADDLLFESDIQAMIDALPEGCKMVFILYSIEGYKHHEIATMLAISEGTSKSQLAYARKLLQKYMIQHKMAENG